MVKPTMRSSFELTRAFMKPLVSSVAAVRKTWFMGSFAEIAGLMAFVVSPAARWMTGSVPHMDGGEVKSV